MKVSYWVVAVHFIAAGLVYAADPVYSSWLSDKAVSGYDTVSFFSVSGPVKGLSEFSTSYMGKTWLFASRANLDLFKADPEKYAPQYGGYCAWAAARDSLAPGDPKYWKIVDGKLYLNYSKKVQSDWEKDIPGFITKANQNWPNLLKE